MYCKECGSEIADNVEVCPVCGIRIKNKKSPTTAAFLSLIWTGLGQIYNGQVAKGIFLWILCLIGLICGLVVGIIIWIYSIWDAYEVAKNN